MGNIFGLIKKIESNIQSEQIKNLEFNNLEIIDGSYKKIYNFPHTEFYVRDEENFKKLNLIFLQKEKNDIIQNFILLKNRLEIALKNCCFSYDFENKSDHSCHHDYDKKVSKLIKKINNSINFLKKGGIITEENMIKICYPHFKIFPCEDREGEIYENKMFRILDTLIFW